MEYFLKNAFSLLCTAFIYLIGGLDIAFASLVIVMSLDYITGLISAIYNKEVSSKIGFKGILKKMSYLACVMLAVVLDILLNQNGIIRTVIIYFFVANDGISIIENLAEIGIKLPNKIIECLEQIKKRGE